MITTFTGKQFDPLWVTPESIDHRDIAHALSYIPRFAGHTRYFYPVAQHCCLMTQWFLKRRQITKAKWTLLHEGEEAYMLDMPTPIKYLDEMTPYRVLGKNVQYAIYRKYGLLGEPPKEVKELDTQIVIAEARELFKPTPQYWLEKDLKVRIKIEKWSQVKAEKEFLKLFERLFV